MMRKSIYLCACLILAPTIAIAAQFNDEIAVKGLSRIKIVCDVNVRNPVLLLIRM
jgi:hypothetical protein